MSIIDLLRKLGIIRFGAKKAVYHSGKDRPLEFMEPAIFNADKETIRAKPQPPELPRKSSPPTTG